MKRKIVLVTCIIAVITALGFGAIAVSTADLNAANPDRVADQIHKGQILRVLVGIKDQAKLESVLTQLEANGKITTEQASRITNLWIKYHDQVRKGIALKRLLRIGDEAKLELIIGQGVSTGKITSDQAAKIKALWQELHLK